MFNGCKEVSVDKMFVIIGMEEKIKNKYELYSNSGRGSQKTARKPLRHGKLTRGRTVKVVVYLQA